MPLVTPKKVATATGRMERSLAAFNKELADFSEKLVPKDLLKLHRYIAMSCLEGVVKLTPVDTGRARGNWQVSVNDWDEKEKQERDPIAVGIANLKKLKPYDVVFLTNNVPYILYLEAGSSKQAPKGMVAQTLNRVIKIFP